MRLENDEAKKQLLTKLVTQGASLIPVVGSFLTPEDKKAVTQVTVASSGLPVIFDFDPLKHTKENFKKASYILGPLCFEKAKAIAEETEGDCYDGNIILATKYLCCLGIGSLAGLANPSFTPPAAINPGSAALVGTVGCFSLRKDRRRAEILTNRANKGSLDLRLITAESKPTAVATPVVQGMDL